MKFFHLSDLHIGLKLINRDLREDQEYILKQILENARREQPEAVVIAGDIYDKAVPSAEAVEVFDHFIAELTEALPEAVLMLISGNHDSGPRVNCFRSVLSRQDLYMVGLPPMDADSHIEKVTLKDEYGNVNFYLLPFVKPSMVRRVLDPDGKDGPLTYDAALRGMIGREQIDEGERNVLVSHQFYLPSGKKAEEIERMDSEIRTAGNIDEVSVEVLRPFDYAALGHIHKPMQVGTPYFRYCGTPLACSVSEAGQEKGILMVEMKEKGETDITVLPLKPLRQVRIQKGELAEVLKEGSDDYVTVILTDREDLDVIDMQERIRMAFPHLLEIRRETLRQADYSQRLPEQETLSPFELCCAFMKDMSEEEKEILRDVIHTVQEVK